MYLLNVEGVRLMVGTEVAATKDVTMSLGTVTVRVLRDDDTVTNHKVNVVADISDVRGRLTGPLTRNDWERSLRLAVGNQTDLHDLFQADDSDALITDVFPVRLNQPVSLIKANWRNNDSILDLDGHLNRLSIQQQKSNQNV